VEAVVIATLTLFVALLAPAQAQEPPPAEAEPVAVEAEAEARDLAAEVEALRLLVEEQNLEIEDLREQLGGADVVHEETLEVDFEDLEVAPERVSFGSSVVVLPGEVVEEAASFGGDVEVSGRITGDATAFGGSVRVRDGGAVDGDAVSFGGRVEVEPGGAVQGDRVSMGSPVPKRARSASPAVTAQEVGRGFLSSLYHRLVFMLSFLGAGVLVVGLFPDRVGRVAEALEEAPLRSLAVGAFTTLGLLFAAVVFAVTVVGIPLTVLLVSLLALSWLVGFVGLCQALGDRMPFLDKPQGRWVAFLLGALIVSFVGVLPIVGWVAVIAASMLGMGAAITSRFGSMARS
jgi:hypothetical protein